MKVNEEAVYETEADPLLGNNGQWVFTKKGDVVYAIYQAKENETQMPEQMEIPFDLTNAIKNVTLLGSSQKLKVKQVTGKLQVIIPKAISQKPPAKEAWVFKIETQVKN
jgi:hypothetical protein